MHFSLVKLHQIHVTGDGLSPLKGVKRLRIVEESGIGMEKHDMIAKKGSLRKENVNTEVEVKKDTKKETLRETRRDVISKSLNK